MGKTIKENSRLKILQALSELNDEAFSWIVLAMLPSAMLQGANCQIWPDGLGGFQDNLIIEQIRKAAKQYVESEN